MIVMPGVVDPHTHYDAQLFWDPTASPSNDPRRHHRDRRQLRLHPRSAATRPRRADYTPRDDGAGRGHAAGRARGGRRRGTGRPSPTTSTELEGNIAVNAGFLVGHCALRRYVMGADAVGNEATPEQIEAMVAELRKAHRGRRTGLLHHAVRTHSDGDGQPVPEPLVHDRGAHRAVRRDRQARGHHPRGHRPTGASTASSDDEIELFAEMSAAAKRPLNWNVLTIDSREADRVPRQLSARRPRRRAGRAHRGPHHAGAGAR